MATVTHNIDIRARSSGFRVVRRKIDEIGVAANNATRGIFLMQRAIFVLGGAGAIRALSRQVDMLTNMENRLRLTATSTANLEEVQTRLFQVARDSRSAFEGVAEIYNRTALSVRELGISQQETLRFTESLAKATIISGASAREANAALIQLGQGMASNTLRGDELRSVLEQLPFVADVIAKHLGITRGELREFGKEGKISAETVLDAFRGAEAEIDMLFAQTVPTISQALSVANTNWLEFIDNLDDSTGASAKLAGAIIILSENLNLILGTIATVGAIFVLNFTGKMVASAFKFITSMKASAVASARLLEIENIRAASIARTVKARQASNIVEAAAIRQGIVQLNQNRALLIQQKANQAITVQNGRARSALTGQFVALNAAQLNLNRTSRALLLTERALVASGRQLTVNTAAQAAATNTAAVANTRLATSAAASGTVMAQMSRRFPLIAGSLATIGRLIPLISNPLGALVAVLLLISAAFIKWGNLITPVTNKMVGLRDLAVAAFQLIAEKVQPVIDIIGVGISNAITTTQGFFSRWLTNSIKIAGLLFEAFFNLATAIPRVFIAMIAGINAAWDSLPGAAAEAAVGVANFIAEGFEKAANFAIDSLNKIIRALNDLIAFVGGTKAAELFGFSGKISEISPVTIGRMTSSYAGAGKKAGDAYVDGFGQAWEATSFEAIAGKVTTALTPAAQAIADRATANVQNAAATQKLIDLANQQAIAQTGTKPPKKPGTGGKGGGKTKKDFAGILAGMQQEIELLRLTNKERKLQEGLLGIEKELKRSLTDQEKALAVEALKALEAAKAQASVLEAIIGPRDKAAEQLAALNELYAQGRIGIEDYTNALREMQVAAAATSGTLAGGFKAAIGGAILSASELGSALGDIVVNGADSAADAIVEFARTGKFNMKEFFGDIFAQITKLIAKQLILKALGFALGGFSEGGSIGGVSVPRAAAGGSILPTGAGSTDTDIVSFAKRPDERVDILTPGQQAAQRNNTNSGGGTTVVQSPPVNVAAVFSTEDITGAFDSDAGETVVINMLQRNASTVRSIVNG